MKAETRRFSVGLSVEALTHNWARSEAAPSGSAVAVEQEISARLRGGVEWREPDSLAVGIVTRPSRLTPESANLAWLAAGLGTLDAFDAVRDHPPQCLWPDSLALEPDEHITVKTGAADHLGPGRVEYTILTTRIGRRGESTEPLPTADQLIEHLRHAAELLEDGPVLVAAYEARCATIGSAVAVTLLPYGAIRGTATHIDATGAIVIESPTGLREVVPIGSLKRLEPVERDGQT